MVLLVDLTEEGEGVHHAVTPVLGGGGEGEEGRISEE